MKQVLFFLSLLWSMIAVGQGVPSDQIIGHYPFNGNAINVLNSNLNGTVSSGVKLGEDRFGHANAAYVFDGTTTNPGISVANSSAFNILPLSTSFWFNASVAKGVLISKYTNASNNGFRAVLYDNGDGTARMDVWYLNGKNSDCFASIPVKTNAWYHCAINFESGKTSLYLNGVLVGTDATTNTATSATTTTELLRFGSANNGTDPALKGSMDDIRFYKRALTLAEITNLANSTGVAAYYPFSGNAKDVSGNQLDGTLPATGVTATIDAWGIANSAYKFDGTGMITTPLRQIAVTQYTVSAWVKMNSGEYGTIVSNTGGKSYSNATSATTSDVGVCFGVDDDGKLRFGVVGQYIFRGVKSTKTVNDGQWHHVVAVLDCPTNTTLADGNSCTGVFKTYVDGIDCAGYDNGGGTAKAPFTGLGNTAIGEMDGVIGVPTAKAKGIIDEVRISNEALTANEVTALYLQNTASRGLLLYYPLDGNTKDSSGNGLDGSIKSYQGYNVTTSSSGINLTKNRFGIANSAYLFNPYLSNTSVVGSIDRPTDAKLDFKSTDCLSFSCWLNLTSFAGMDGNPRYSTNGCQTLFAKDGDAGAFRYNYTTGRLQFELPSTTTETKTPIDDSYVPKLVGQWNHIALSVTPTSKKIYVNGKLVWTATGTYDLSKMNGKGIAFGHSYGSYWYPLNGSLDDIRLFNRALTQDEVSVLATNTLLLSKTSATTATTATIPNTFPASNTFTVEMWVKPNTLVPQFQRFFGSDGSYKVPIFHVQGIGLLLNLDGGIGNGSVSNVFTANQWTHVAWANENGIAKIYKNGVLVATRQNNGIVKPKDSVATIMLSAVGDWAFDGQLDEVRIWSTARTAAQIQANLNKELSVGSQTGLTASYSFNGTMSNTTINSIGSLNTAAYAYTPEALRTPALRACTAITATGFTANWCPLPGAWGYQLQYASDNAFTKPTTITAAASDSLKAITGLTAGVYYVRIQAQIPLTTITYGNWSEAITVSTPFSSPGKGVSLTGDARYVQVPSGNWFNGKATVEGWVYLKDKQASWARFFDFSNGVDNDNVLLCFNGNESNGMAVVGISNLKSTKTQFYTTDSVRLRTWTHVAMTLDGTTVKVYFNGKLVFNRSDMAVASNVVRTQNYIGYSPWNDPVPNAIFDEFRIYNKALTQAQIVQNAHKHLTSTEPNLVLYYDFDNVNGVVPDLSNSKADGFLVNTPAFANSQALLTPFTLTATNNQANNSFTATWDDVQNPSFELQYALDTTFTLGLSKTYIATTNTLTVNVPTDWSKVFCRVRYKKGQDSSVWVSNSIKLAQTPPALALSLNNTTSTKNLSVDKYLSVPSSTCFNGNFTVDAWVNPRSLQSDVRLFDFGTGGASNSVLMACGQYVKFTTATGTDAAVIAIPSVPLSQWTHVALTYNATTNVAAVYYNGVWVAGAVVTTGPTAISRTSNFIGASNTGNPSSDMLIDEFRMYNEVLVTDTIIARSHRHLKGTESNLVLYYDFDQTQGDVVPNLVANGIAANGTLKNTPALVNSKALLTPFVRGATAISQTGFTANWDAVPSASEYQLQYTAASATSFDGVTVNSIKSATTKSFAITGTAGSSYQYRVRAISNRDTSEWSVRKITLPVAAPGNALSLDNTSATKDLTKDKYVVVPSGKWLNGSYTIDAWVYRRTAKENDRFFDFGNGAKENVLFAFHSSGAYLNCKNIKGENLLDMRLPVVPVKQWTHIAFTLDSVGKKAYVYYNGVPVGSNLNVTYIPAMTRSFNYIGASNFPNDLTSDMLIDEFRISNRALSEAEIADRMHRHLDVTKETDLQLYYDFDYIEGDGQTVADLTGKKQNGILMNTPSYAASKALLTPFTISSSDVTTAGFTASCENIAVATGYDFQYVVQGKTDSLIVSTTANTGIISGLQAAITYSYRVRSKTAAFTGEWSKSATVTLPANAPANALQCNTTDKASGTLKTALGTAFTVECWVAPSTASFDVNYREILGSPEGNRLFPTMWIYGTTLRFEGYSVAQKVYDIPNFFNKNEADAWVHIAWVQNGSNSSFYRNGVLVGTSTAFTESLTGIDFVLNYTGDNSLLGKLDEVRFWNKALTQKDIKAGLHKHLAGTDANLVAYYDFDYTNGKIITDLTANKQNATMTNTPIYSASKALLTPFIRTIDSVKTNNKITQLNVTWDAIPTATYKWQVSDAANFSNILTDAAKAINDTTASIAIDGKQYAYYYRIIATNADGKVSDTTRGTFADPSLTIPNMAYNGTALSVANTTDIQLNGNDAVTMRAWVKFSAQNNSAYIYKQSSSTSGASYKDFSIANGVLSIAYSATDKLSCPTAMSPNVWNHVAFTQNAGTLTLYVNGTACNSKTLETAAASTISSSPASIGGNVSIDNFQIWKAALSQSDIVKYAHTEVFGTESNLAVAYDFNQIDGATIKDVATTTATPASVINSTTVWNTSKAQLTPFVYAASKVNDSSFVAKWSKDAAAKTYTLRYATTPDFTAPVLRYALTDTILPIQNLQSGIKYYLSIRSVFASDSSEWSAPLVVSTTSLTDSLIAYYPFNGSANNMIGNVAAKTNTASITTDRFGKANSAYDFTNGSINAGNVNNLDTSFTIAAWINQPLANTSSAGIVSKFIDNGSSNFDGYFLSINEDAVSGNVKVTTANTSNLSVSKATKNIAPAIWNFVCARLTKKQIQLFVNNSLIATQTVPVGSESVKTTADFLIGKFNLNGSTNTFQGSIDDIRIYRRPLSDGELSNLYHEGGWPYTGIAISNTSFKEQQNIGTTVGVLSPVVDKSATDTSTTFSYRLVAGVGSTDNDKFTIAGDGKTLLSNYIFDITQQTTASVRIQGTNTRTSVSFSYPVSITITDASITEVYDFESFNANELLSARDTWKGTPSVKVEQLVSPNTKAVSSTEPVDASNLLSNLFKTVKIDDLSAQYVLSYDVSSSDWGTFVGLMYDPQNKGIVYATDYATCNVFQFKTSTRSDASSYFFKPDYSSVSLLATQFTGWYRVEVTFSNLNTANATITARAKSLASAGTSWMPILNETTIAIDSTATDKKNPRNWNTFYTHIEGSTGIVDNLSFSKRVKNANRVTTTDGLVLWFKMDNNLFDASGNKHDGVQAVGTSTPAYDRFGNANSAYDMKGTSTFHVDGFGKYTPTTEISVSAWAKNNSTYNSSSLFMLLNDNLTYRFNAHLCNSVVFDFGDITGSAPLARVTTVSSQTALYQTTNVWNHYVFTSSQKSNSMNIYMNNVLVATKTITTSITQDAKRWLDIATYGYNGVIDDFRVYNRELSATEVASLYYEGGWPVQKITVPSNVLLQPNMSTMLSVTATPSDAKAAPLVYSSNNPAIATIDNTGKITAVKTGVTTITVTTANSSVSATCVVTVQSDIVKLTKLALNDSALNLTVLNNVPKQLKYTSSPSGAFLTGIRWMSSNSAVVSVTEKGVISALTPGTAMIYVSDTLSKLKDSCSISVLPSLKPILVAGQVDTFKLRAVTKVNGVWEAIMPLKITLPVFFKDDDSLTYSYTLVDTINQSLSGDTLLVSQKTAGVSATKPIVLSLTATDRNAQRTTKFITIKMMSVPDLAPVFKGPALADTMYQFRRTTVVDLSKYIIDDFTPFNRLTFTKPELAHALVGANIVNGKLSIIVDAALNLSTGKAFSDTVRFMVSDGILSSSIKVAYNYKSVIDLSPVFTSQPNIKSENSDTVVVINLSKISHDDLSPNTKLRWNVVRPININAQITDSILTLSSNNSSWTGSENITVYVYDEGDNLGTGTIVYSQSGFTPGPKISFSLEVYNADLKLYSALPAIVAKGTKVYAQNTTLAGVTVKSGSYRWLIGTDTVAKTASYSQVFDKTGTYSVTLIADNNSGRTTVVQKDAITVVGIDNLKSKSTICKGDTVVLACSNRKLTCAWSTSETSEVYGSEFVAVPSKTTTYYLKMTSGNTDVVDSIKITVINPIADVAKDTAVCAGVAYELKPSGFAKLFWKGATKSAISYTTSKTDTIAVSALVDTVGACPAILDTIKVTRLALPVIGLPAKEVVCLHSSKKLVALGGNTINDYKWNKSTVLSDTLIAKEEGTYIVTVKAANGCSTSDTTVVTIDSLPKVIVSANKLVSCKNAVIQLSTKTKVAGLIYNWNVPVTADTTAVLVADGYNDFYVSVTNANGCTGWDSVRVNANTNVAVTISPNKEITACYGKSTDFTATGAESYEWSNGTKTAGITLIAGNGLSNTQKVYVTATKDGCVGIDSAILTARPRPVVKIDASTDTLCKGDSLQLTASGCKTYSWNGTVANGVKFAVDQSTRYRVTATDEFACQVVDSIFIKVNELTALKAVANDSSICLGDSIRLYGRGAKSYTWDAPIVDSVKFKPTKAESITYAVTGVDTNSCKATATVEVAVNALPTIQIAKQDSVCKGATTVLTATGTAKTYVWSDAVVNGESFIPADSKRYTVTATTDKGCVDTSSVKVNVKTSAATSTLTLASRDVTLCKGDSLQLNGEGDFTTIVWNETIADNTWATPLKDSIFTVKATDAQKCVVTDAVKVTVNNRPEVTAHVSASVSCQGRSIKLWATATETVTYSWSETLSATDSSFTLTALGDKTFIVTATNGKQCSDTAKVKVTVNAAVSVDLKAITDTICAGDSVLLDAKGTFAKATWSTGTANGKYVKPTQNTQYNVVVTDNVACESKDSIQVIVHALPNVTANHDTTVCAGRSITLAAKGATKYTWNNAAVDGVAKTITDNTTFTVTGTDANKCSNTAVVKVSVLKPYKEQLGVVTYNEAGTGLIVAWTPTKGKRTAKYEVLRLNDTTAKYNVIATRYTTDSSIFVDKFVNATKKAYVYRLVTHDSVCNNTDTSDLHRTIHLTNTQSTDAPSKVSLHWTAYQGLNVAGYKIYVLNNGAKVDSLVEATVAGLQTYSQDYDKHQNGYKYRIAFKLPSVVTVSKLKSDSGPFSQSFSNMSEASLVSVGSFDADGVSVWPVPTKDIIHVELTNNKGAHIVLFDDNGKQVAQTILVNDAAEIATESLSSGLYLLQVHTNAGLISKKITIVK